MQQTPTMKSAKREAAMPDNTMHMQPLTRSEREKKKQGIEKGKRRNEENTPTPTTKSRTSKNNYRRFWGIKRYQGIPFRHQALTDSLRPRNEDFRAHERPALRSREENHALCLRFVSTSLSLSLSLSLPLIRCTPTPQQSHARSHNDTTPLLRSRNDFSRRRRSRSGSP
jgi:hypothetical protein